MNPARKRKQRRVLLAVLASLFLLSGGTYAGVNTASAKPDIQFQISPASQSVARGQTAIYTVTMTSTGGFVGNVGLSVSGLPNGATASLTPPALTLGTGATLTSVLNVTTAAGTPVGPSTLKVTGTSGKVSGSITAGLTINYSLSGALSMTATPASVNLAPGEIAICSIRLDRARLAGNVTLNITSGLPTGATWAFAPNSTTGDTSTLQVTIPETTKDGNYTLILGASGKDSNGDTKSASANVKLGINTNGKSFAISGSVSGLAPGLTKPLELSLTNPNKKSISVTNLSVTLQGVTKAVGAPDGLCDLSDYAVVQYSGPYPLIMPSSSTPKTLTDLGVPQAQWPKIQFINKPGPSAPNNQDGCKGATLSLSYSGSAQGN